MLLKLCKPTISTKVDLFYGETTYIINNENGAVGKYIAPLFYKGTAI